MTKSRETFHFDPVVEVKEDWMIGLINLEVYNSSFIITEENNKCEPQTYLFDNEFSFTKLKDKGAKMLGISDISIEDLEPE